METVCLKCGDRGFPETLVVCKECQACALHRYCLDGPVIFIDDVIWFCEDCEAKLVPPSSPHQSTDLSSETIDSENLANNAIQVRREVKSTERKKKTNLLPQKKIKMKPKKENGNSVLVAKTDVLLSDSHSSPEFEHPQCSISCEEESEFKNDCGPIPRDAANCNAGSKSVQISQVATNDDDLNCVEFDSHVDAQPIAVPIWRGSLYFCNATFGNVSGLLGHLSSLACSKVQEATEALPTTLSANLLCRSVVWPKSFENGGPRDESIALYFFPDNERAEKDFDALVEDCIRQELAIRVLAENSELLIFPSTVLPIQHWRFRSKYYLWGVFRRKQTS